MQFVSPNSSRDTPDAPLSFIDLPSCSLETGHSPASSSRGATKRQQRDTLSRTHPTTFEAGSKRPRACILRRRYFNTMTSGERSGDCSASLESKYRNTTAIPTLQISSSAFEPIARKTDGHEMLSRVLETTPMDSNFIGEMRPSKKREVREVSPRIVPLEVLIKDSEKCPPFPRKEGPSKPPQTLHSDSQIRSLAHEGTRHHHPSTEFRDQNLPKAPNAVEVTEVTEVTHVQVKESVASLRRDFKMLSANTRFRDSGRSAMKPRSIASVDDGLLPVCSLPPRASAQTSRSSSAVITLDNSPQKRDAEEARHRTSHLKWVEP